MAYLKKVKEQVVTTLEVPRDLAFGETIVTLTGQKHVLIENYRSIQKLTTEEIIILCVHGKIILSGQRMKVDHYTPHEMLITGRVVQVLMER